MNDAVLVVSIAEKEGNTGTRIVYDAVFLMSSDCLRLQLYGAIEIVITERELLVCGY